SALPTVADEPASQVRDDSQGEACPTDSGFITDQDRQPCPVIQHQGLLPLLLKRADAANVLTGETNVPTGSGSIPTAGPPTT
nr:hypothetical protein [Tanacetum cinerariifolium]